MQKKKSSHSEELYGELGRAFNFTHGDLEANRAGFISHRQRGTETSKIWNGIILLLIMFLACAVLWTLTGTLMLSFGGKCQPVPCNELSSSDKFERISGVIAMLALPFLGLVIWSYVNHYRDMRQGRVEKLLSRVSSIVRSGGRSGTHYYLISPEREFTISKAQYEFAWQEAPYIIYYLPFSKYIVAIEPAQHEDTMGKKLPIPNVPYGEYGKVFNFTQSDLEANRAGFISPAQKEEFQRVQIRGVAAMGCSGIILIACFLYISINFVLWAMQGFVTNSLQAAEFFISLTSSIFILLSGIIFLVGYSAYKRSGRNSKESHVQIYNGYELYQAENKGVFLSFEKEKLLKTYPVRIYAVPSTKQILSVHILLPEQG